MQVGRFSREVLRGLRGWRGAAQVEGSETLGECGWMLAAEKEINESGDGAKEGRVPPVV